MPKLQGDFSNLKKQIVEANDILNSIIKQKQQKNINEKQEVDSGVDLLDVSYKQIAYILQTNTFNQEEILFVQNSLELSIKQLQSQKLYQKEVKDLNRILDDLKINSKNQLKDTLNEFNKSKDSKIELTSDKNLKSQIFFQNTIIPTQKDPKGSSIYKDQFQTQFRELFLRLDHKKQIINPLQLVINKQIQAENPEVLFYVLSDQMRRANRSFFKSLQYDEQLMFSFHGQFTADSQDSLAYSLTLQETSNLSYKNIASDIKIREEFLNQIKKCLSKQYNVQEHQIQIIALEKGSIKIIFEIMDFAGGVQYSENFKELQDCFPGCQPQIKIHDYFKTAALSIKDFAPNYNMVWDEFVFGNYDDRGPEGKTQPYFFPIGWKGYALNVAGRYGNNDNWLKMDNNKEEWYVMFHGTNFDGFKGIMDNQRKFKVGKIQAFENYKCMLTNKKIGRGVYFSNHIEICEGYGDPTEINGNTFQLAFQSRVKPEALRQCQKHSDLTTFLEQYKRNNKYLVPSLNDMNLWDNDYFLINNTCDIRPYRILLKKINNR